MQLPYAEWLASRDRQENLFPNEVVKLEAETVMSEVESDLF
jgi:hypothetical protein